MTRQPIPWRRITAEFFVIFAGITLSLAADDWRQGLEDRSREAEIVRDLADDLLRDSVELASVMAYAERWDEASVWLNQNSGSGGAISEDALHHLRSLGFISLYQPVTSAYATVRDAGLMYLLEDSDLRRRVVDYYEMQQLLIAQLNGTARDGWDRWFRVSAGHLDWGVLPDSASMWRRHENMRVRTSVPRMMADEAVAAHIDWAGLIGGNAVWRIRPALDVNGQLRTDLEAYLAR